MENKDINIIRKIFYDLEKYRPNFPPDINMKEYVFKNVNNKDLGKIGAYMLYRIYLRNHLMAYEVKFSMQKYYHFLASILWMNEPHFVRKHYMDLTKRINKLLNDEHIQNSINQKRKQPPDCEDNERMSPKKIKDMNDRNSFIFFRGELDKYLSQLGYSLTMQENLDLASTLWSKQSENVKNMYKEKSQQDNYSMSYNMSYD